MNLYTQILSQILSRRDVEVSFKGLGPADPDALVESACLGALNRIHAILDDDALDDFACVEAIVRVFEDIGSDGGARHDF